MKVIKVKKADADNDKLKKDIVALLQKVYDKDIRQVARIINQMDIDNNFRANLGAKVSEINSKIFSLKHELEK